MKKTIVLALTSMALTAFANGQRQSDRVAMLGFDDIKLACQNPARFHNQTAPTNIQVSCQDLTYKWIPDNSGAITMNTGRQVTTSVYSDKYSVAPISAVIATEPQSAACPNFKEVVEKLETVRAVSCEELIAYTGTAAEFCATTASSLKSASPESVSVTDTGKTLSLCAVSHGRGQHGQHGQRGQK